MLAGLTRKEILFWLVAMSLAFASYDVVVLIFTNSPMLFNVNVYDGWRIDESYMYLAGLDKNILFDPYLKNHAHDLTLRPLIPDFIFRMIYLLSLKNINIAILLGHTIFPVISCALIYLISFKLTKSKSTSLFAMLLAAGHSVFTLHAITSAILGVAPFGVTGPLPWLAQYFFGFNEWLGYLSAPNQFTRLYSPALTLPFLLLPLYLGVCGNSPSWRAILISLNLYVYPHHVLYLAAFELFYVIQNRKFPPIRFFVWGMLAAIPFLAIQWLLKSGGHFDELYARVGVTHDRSPMWFFCFAFVACFALFSALSVQRKVILQPLYFVAACLLPSLVIWAVDTWFVFPQVHLIGLRVLVFLLPVCLCCVISELKKEVHSAINAVFLVAFLMAMVLSAWNVKGSYTQLSENKFLKTIIGIPENSVIMTDAHIEQPYISAFGRSYPYVAYSIVSAAGNDELMMRFAVLAKVYDWNFDRLNSDSWDGLLGPYHWIYHHGNPSREIRTQEIRARFDEVSKLSKCEAIKLYEVDFIRVHEQVPPGLEGCTSRYSEYLLKVDAS